MGIDVNLYAEADPSDDELARAEEFFNARSTLADRDSTDPRSLVRYSQEWLPTSRVEVNTLSRYYGPGYERGDWPRIYGGIRVLKAAFPGAKVFYGGDSTDDGDECTDDLLDQIWAHFLSPDGDNYRARSRMMMEAFKP